MPRVKQFDRDEVLTKAMDLFWLKGYNATSMRDLVQHTGISSQSIYDTFGGKDQLYQEVLKMYRSINHQQFVAIEESLKHNTAKATLEAFFTRMLKEIRGDKEHKGCMVVNATTELCNQSDFIWQMAASNKEGFVKAMKKLIITGQEADEISKTKDADAVARQLVIFFNGLRVIGQIEKSPKKLKAAVDLQLAYIFE